MWCSFQLDSVPAKLFHKFEPVGLQWAWCVLLVSSCQLWHEAILLHASAVVADRELSKLWEMVKDSKRVVLKKEDLGAKQGRQTILWRYAGSSMGLVRLFSSPWVRLLWPTTIFFHWTSDLATESTFVLKIKENSTKSSEKTKEKMELKRNCNPVIANQQESQVAWWFLVAYRPVLFSFQVAIYWSNHRAARWSHLMYIIFQYLSIYIVS